MTKPKYTFLLPAFKAQYFEEALRSIKNQTYRNFKVLVSDDGVCILEEIREFRSSKNPSAKRQTGIL